MNSWLDRLEYSFDRIGPNPVGNFCFSPHGEIQESLIYTPLWYYIGEAAQKRNKVDTDNFLCHEG
jgi:hypothetical protein